MMTNHSGGERQARLGVLDDLIKYMRKRELEKDMPEDALGEGLGAVAEKMAPDEEVEDEDMMEHGKPEAIVEIEAGPKEEMVEHDEAEGEEPLEEEDEELSPFQQKMKDYFNNRDRPKVGKSMSFMMATKTPAQSAIQEIEDEMKGKRSSKPFKDKR